MVAVVRLRVNSFGLFGFPSSFSYLFVLLFQGIFEKHKLLFSFQITVKLEQDRKNVVQEELDFFIKGNIALEKSKRKKPFNWIPDQTWEDSVRLSAEFSSPFGPLLDELERNESEWKSVCRFFC